MENEKMDDGSEELNDRETLECICWNFATTAEEFYPIEETALQCMKGVSENYKGNENMNWEKGLAWEKGQHSRAVLEASEVFTKLESMGYDPVQMAKEHIRKSEEMGHQLPKIDWSWLNFSLLPDEYKNQYLNTSREGNNND